MNTSFTQFKGTGMVNLPDLSLPVAAAPVTAVPVGTHSAPAQQAAVAATLPLFAQSMNTAVTDTASARDAAFASAPAATATEQEPSAADETAARTEQYAAMLPAMANPLLAPQATMSPAGPAGNTVAANTLELASAAPDAVPGQASPAQATPDFGTQQAPLTASLLASSFVFRNNGQGTSIAPASDNRPALAATAPMAARPEGEQGQPLQTQPASAKATLPRAAETAVPADETSQRAAEPTTPAATATPPQIAVASALPAQAAIVMPAIKPASTPADTAINLPGARKVRDEGVQRGAASAQVMAQPAVATSSSVLPENTPAPVAKAAPGVTTASFALPVDSERTTAPAPAAMASPASTLNTLMGVNAAPAASGDTIKLAGPAQQWQEPLREALGERLQTQIGRNSEHAVIRLDPPMLGRIEISIRHQAGALQVNLSASNTEVLRQLQGIGENMRNDLAQRQYTDVAVNINATPRSPAAQAFAEHDGRGQRQPGRQHDDAEPGRALSDGAPAGATFAMHEREYN